MRKRDQTYHTESANTAAEEISASHVGQESEMRDMTQRDKPNVEDVGKREERLVPCPTATPYTDAQYDLVWEASSVVVVSDHPRRYFSKTTLQSTT
jgi:hypothetical protein